jgi:hypothetical protein
MLTSTKPYPAILFTTCVLTAAFLQAGSGARAQSAAPSTTPAFAPTDIIPFDSAVTTATLPNGLRYYIRRNSRP